jgi:hypothetical protein
MTLETKIKYDGLKTMTLLLSHDIYFDILALNAFQSKVACYQKRPVTKDLIKEIHEALNNFFNFCISYGHLSFWETPGLVYKMTKDNDFYKINLPTQETIEMTPPPIENIFITASVEWGENGKTQNEVLADLNRALTPKDQRV